MNIVIGLLSGVAASMGFGGGFVLIIYLTAFADVSQITAQGVNLLFFLPAALVSLIIHQKNGLIKWKVLLRLIPGGLLGIVLGAFTAAHIDVDFLQRLFAGLLIFAGFKEVFHKNEKNSKKHLTNAKISHIINNNEMR